MRMIELERLLGCVTKINNLPLHSLCMHSMSAIAGALFLIAIK